MKIAILHQDLEYQEEVIKSEFEKKGFHCSLFDVRTLVKDDLLSFDLVLNRVFASVANRDYRDNLTTLEILAFLEDNSIKVINSLEATKVDYSKYYASKLLLDNGVLTPKTFFCNDLSNETLSSLDSFLSELSFPVILKRDLGGRAKDLHKVNSKDKLLALLKDKLTSVNSLDDGYAAGYIVQEFVESILDHDYRISVIAGDVCFSSTRSLLDFDGSGKPWLSSASNGSKVLFTDAPRNVIDLAKKSTSVIGALLNEVDIIITAKGPYLIENNPTPNFTPTSKGRRIALEKTLTAIHNLFN